jgi:hypothetical protein
MTASQEAPSHVRHAGVTKAGTILEQPFLHLGCHSLWLSMSTFSGAIGQYLYVQTAARPSGEERSKPSNLVSAAPLGVHTDDLDSMVKRGNIPALVMINPRDSSTTTVNRWASCMTLSKRWKPTSMRS